jgi:hypothetical protein
MANATNTLGGRLLCRTCATGFSLQYNSSVACTPTSGQADGFYYGPGLNASTGQVTPGWYPCTALGCARCQFDPNNNNQICIACAAQYSMTSSGSCQPANLNTFQCPPAQVLVSVTTSGTSQVVCLRCGDGCTNCTYNQLTQGVKCQQCNTTQGYTLNTTLAKCVPSVQVTCSSGQYLSSATLSCQTCPEGCTACAPNQQSATPPVVCTACNTVSYYLSVVYCFKQCPQGQITNYNVQPQVCQNCPSNCQTCDLMFASVSAATAAATGASTSAASQVCLQCSSGYYLQNGGCQAVPNCKTQLGLTSGDAFYVLQSIDKGNQAVQCAKCPNGCLGCSLVNPSQPTAGTICGTCATGFSLNSQLQCLPSIVALMPTCTSSQYTYINGQGAWSACTNCPSNCVACQARFNTTTNVADVTCIQCNTMTVPNMNPSTGLTTCASPPSCSSGMFPYVVPTTSTAGTAAGGSPSSQPAVVCIPCIQSNCAQCTTTNIYSKLAACTQCNSPYTLSSSGDCVQSAASVSDPNTKCSGAQYGFISSNSIYCAPCPHGCSACKSVSPYSAQTAPLVKIYDYLSQYIEPLEVYKV